MTDGTRQTRLAAASAWVGSALEYYDFFIYATAASLIFPQLFFPAGNEQVAIVASLATYGVGYVARPVGAFFLGHWGDRYGRKNVLVLCLFLMGFATLAVGLLPTYAQVGLLAPVLLVVARLIQGQRRVPLVLSGALPNACARLGNGHCTEHRHLHHRDAASSLRLGRAARREQRSFADRLDHARHHGRGRARGMELARNRSRPAGRSRVRATGGQVVGPYRVAYFNRIDTDAIAASRFSCGGIQAFVCFTAFRTAVRNDQCGHERLDRKH